MGKEVNEDGIETMRALRMEGMSNAEIAAALGVSRPTVVKYIGAQPSELPRLVLAQVDATLESETISRRLASGALVEAELGYWCRNVILTLDEQEMMIEEADLAEAAAFLWTAARRMAVCRRRERGRGADDETAGREEPDAQ